MKKPSIPFARKQDEDEHDSSLDWLMHDDDEDDDDDSFDDEDDFMPYPSELLDDEGESLGAYDAALIWMSNGKDEDYMFGYSEDELEGAL